MHYYLGYPLPEAAACLGISLPAAKSRLHRAIGSLRRVITVDGPERERIADLEGGRSA
jgi:DNA-directed RNA polymerase specialized sigma24 family protein